MSNSNDNDLEPTQIMEPHELEQKLEDSIPLDDIGALVTEDDEDGPELSRFGGEDGGVGDLFATRNSSSIHDSEMDTASEGLLNESLNFNPPNVTPIQKTTKSSEQMMEVGRLLKLCGENLKNNASQIAALEVNQEMHHVALLEAKNEIQRAKIYARNRGREFIRDSMDIEYEKSNLVIYNIPLSQWNKFLKHYGNPQIAIRKFAMKWIHQYWPGYLDIDVKPTKIKQDEKEKKHSPNMWRMLLKMASPSDATKLKNRCIAMGFFNIRPGMTKLQRDYCSEVQDYVDNENKKRDSNSETILIRKFQHKVAEVKRADGKFVKWLPYHAPSEPYYRSRMTEKITLVKPEACSDSSSSNSNKSSNKVVHQKNREGEKVQDSGTAKKQDNRQKNVVTNHKPTNSRSRSLSPTIDFKSGSSSGTSRPKIAPTATATKTLTDKLLAPSLSSTSSRKRPAAFQSVAAPSTKYLKVLNSSSESETKKSGRGGGGKGGRGKKNHIPKNQDGKIATPTKLSAAEINKMKVADLKPLHSQTQLKLSELQDDNRKWAEYAAECEQSIKDLQEQLQLQQTLGSSSSPSV